MRSRVRSWRPSPSACAALAFAFALAAPRASADDAVTAARQEVERLRGDIELAYLDVQRDHERTHGAEWGEAAFGDDFSSALTEFIDGVRAHEGEDLDRRDADAASVVVASLVARRIDPPLTRTSLPIVLVETARASRADRKATPRDLFVAAARRVFAAGKVEDVWDARFLGAAVVERFRAAQRKLAAAEKSAAEAESKNAAKSGETPEDKPPKSLDEMVFLDKSKSWIGPWTGWTPDVAEKQNRRQQRPVKAVWFDRYETTCAQYRAFLDALPAASRRQFLPLNWTMDDKDVVQPPAGKDHHPVSGVTFRQAQAYAESQGKRLPTSDEWERAAAGVEKEARAFPWGLLDEGKKWAHLGVEPKGTFPVDAFADDVTPEGIVGMAGNVAEMVATYPDRGDIGKSGPDKSKQVIVCGGSFASRASECTTSFRWVLDADGASPSVGFRCVMDDPEYRKRHK